MIYLYRVDALIIYNDNKYDYNEETTIKEFNSLIRKSNSRTKTDDSINWSLT